MPFGLWLTPAAAEVPDISIQPRISTGIQDYSLEFPSVTKGNVAGGGFQFRDDFKVSDHLSFIGGGLTLGRGRAFLDLSGQATSNGHALGQQFEGDATPFGFSGAVNGGLEHQLDSSFHRREINVTAGWGFTPAFSAYLGYKHSRVDIASQIQPIATALNPVVTGDVLFSGIRRVAFSYDGAFIGATYSVPVSAAHGSFSVQSSLARLNGRYDETFRGVIAEVVSTSPLFLLPIDPAFGNRAPIHGDSLGLNVGASWSGDLGWLRPSLTALSYTIGIDRSEYKFSSRQTIYANFQETSTRLRLDLRYRFAVPLR